MRRSPTIWLAASPSTRPAYAIQGEGAKLVDHYDGSLDTIIGLPATRLIKEFPDLVNAEAAEC